MRAGCAASDGEKGVTAFLWNMSEIFDRISISYVMQSQSDPIPRIGVKDDDA